jgi:diphthine-ammonia ligase
MERFISESITIWKITEQNLQLTCNNGALKMKVAISWSGGIESALACHKVIEEGHDVKYLVAFVAETWPANCHPVEIMELQSKSIGIPLLKLPVKEPFDQTYREAIKKLVEMGIEGIVTGDIYVVDDLHGRWMDRVTEGLGIKVIMPLWEQNTTEVLNDEVQTGFRSVFTCLGKQWFTKEWLGRELNKASAKDLIELSKTNGVDPCGENGEFHSMTIDGPTFKEVIEISMFTKHEHNDRLYIKISEFCLKPKTGN